MQYTPTQAAGHLKESIASYLESQYRISHPLVFNERAELLRQTGVIAQEPFIEATPAFATDDHISTLEITRPDAVTPGLSQIVEYGLPVGRFPLYTHQQDALLASASQAPNLLVASGTGSGKTEAFVLPILSRILREAKGWERPGGQTPVEGSLTNRRWFHSRRHERRPAAMRAVILYPMNALVNDQMSRLRRILALNTSPQWQRQNLNGNLIHFGMYTSLTETTGRPDGRGKLNRWREHLQQVRQEWDQLSPDLKNAGNWPYTNGPEMLCRWDIQAAPPDILVTNYSMLEYMLIRPIEAGIFDTTREWLDSSSDNKFTLVLDEAHTYTGANGTEVAHLIRRLKDRLGIASGDDKLRAIATSASINPAAAGDPQDLTKFTAELFGEPQETFTFIQAGVEDQEAQPRTPDPDAMKAFATFHEGFDIDDPMPAIDRLSDSLGVTSPDQDLDPTVALHDLLEDNETLRWARARTARNATLISELSQETWPGDYPDDIKDRATAGLLAAGSFARPEPQPDTQPLLSMRVHTFFRGLAGVWACIDPNCSEIPAKHKGDRPVGKLYTDPRIWCSCGARVLEIFTCRKCGLIFLGGVPDSGPGALWPWSDQFDTTDQPKENNYAIFCAERPHPNYPSGQRSTTTTLPCRPDDKASRPAFEIEPARDRATGNRVSPFPQQCPRCQNNRFQDRDNVREVIESLRTRGPRSISVVMEDSLRIQNPSASGSEYQAKALVFTDSRQDAALLAADIRRDHRDDSFRQLLYHVLHTCRTCLGVGVITEDIEYRIGAPASEPKQCLACNGSGQDPSPQPMTYHDLRSAVIDLQLQRGFNPTGDHLPDAHARIKRDEDLVYRESLTSFDVMCNRELNQQDFGLEPLGLGVWNIAMPEATGAFTGMSEAESQLFIRTVARILATTYVLLPPAPANYWEWPRDDRMQKWERQRLVNGSGKPPANSVRYYITGRNKLARYARAVANALQARRSITNTEQWLSQTHNQLWEALTQFQILTPAGQADGNMQPYGICIDKFTLHSMGDTIHRCSACRYVMGEALLNVCYRCGQQTTPESANGIANFYRRMTRFAQPASDYPDPYPVRAIEHTAAVGRKEARNIERWFQNLFLDTEEASDHRIDILSVTTTMEMGIDIGSLLAVGLRNVAPTVANYQQRAGRAGRRGSAVASVVTYALDRNHDQYYFHRPKEIVSEPPRVPTLYMDNEVIARRHFRSLILAGFFTTRVPNNGGGSLFHTWGNDADFVNSDGRRQLREYIRNNRKELRKSAEAITSPVLHSQLRRWAQELPQEVHDIAAEDVDSARELLNALTVKGLVPKYAFPVDVVSLAIPSEEHKEDAPYESQDYYSGISRDLRIAISEYAPGAEVIRGKFPDTYVYTSSGVYDPNATQPDYSPTHMVCECPECHAVTTVQNRQSYPKTCQVCEAPLGEPEPAIQPRGFTVDQAKKNNGRVKYNRQTGRQRAGFSSYAQLMVGASALAQGQSQRSFAPRLYTHVQAQGQMLMRNRGPRQADGTFGFKICDKCGRQLGPDDKRHRYPAPVPPHRGAQWGPRAGYHCSNRNGEHNVVSLIHEFSSEVIILSVDLPSHLSAPISEPSGRAVWHSFITLIKEAAARRLQIVPDEIQAGVRPVKDLHGRIQGETYIYDDVPGGAGYARSIHENLHEVVEAALEAGRDCQNPACESACYHCLLSYSNQRIHHLLDRQLGTAMLEFILNQTEPPTPQVDDPTLTERITDYLSSEWKALERLPSHQRISLLFETQSGNQIGVMPIHPMEARPNSQQLETIFRDTGVRVAAFTTFDIERRPFWVADQFMSTMQGI